VFYRRGRSPNQFLAFYAALKRRSSTVTKSPGLSRHSNTELWFMLKADG